MKKRFNGSSPLLMLILVGFLLVLLSAGVYYFLKFTGRIDYTGRQQSQFIDDTGVSVYDDFDTIEAELEDTEVGEFESDFEVVDSEVRQL